MKTSKLTLFSLIALFICCLNFASTASDSYFEPLYSFTYLNFTFPTTEQTNAYFAQEVYKSCIITGVKSDAQGNIYVCSPRAWSSGVPATVSRLVNNTSPNNSSSPVLLEPYPSWEMNKVGNASALQSVLGFEIDNQNRMWILDQGRVNYQAAIPGSVKLVIWDLTSNKLVQQYTFKPEEASLTNSFLNDIVVDTSRGLAYISDSGTIASTGPQTLRPAIIVYNITSNSATRVLDSHYSTSIDSTVWVTSANEKCFKNSPIHVGVNGIALSCDYSTLYWSPLTSRALYAISTQDLLDNMNNAVELGSKVVQVGQNRTSANDGLACSSARSLYITGVETASIYTTNEQSLSDMVKQNRSDQLTNDALITLAHNETSMIWPDAFGFSVNGGELLAVTNDICRWIQGDLLFNTTRSNYHIYKIPLQDKSEKSYVFGCSAKQPESNTWKWIVIAICGVAFVALVVAVTIYAVRINKRDDTRYLLHN